jgi:hypothetical protein
VSGQLHAWPLYPRWKSPRYSLGRRVDGVEERKFLTLLWLEPRLLGRPARSAVTIPSALSRLPQWNKYGNKISVICTFVSYIYRDQKHLINARIQQKLIYWNQSILGNWFRKLDHRFPTVDCSPKPIKLNLQYKKIIQNFEKLEKGINLTTKIQWGAQIKLITESRFVCFINDYIFRRLTKLTFNFLVA